MIREAKDKAEAASQMEEEQREKEKFHFGILFDNYQVKTVWMSLLVVVTIGTLYRYIFRGGLRATQSFHGHPQPAQSRALAHIACNCAHVPSFFFVYFQTFPIYLKFLPMVEKQNGWRMQSLFQYLWYHPQKLTFLPFQAWLTYTHSHYLLVFVCVQFHLAHAI